MNLRQCIQQNKEQLDSENVSIDVDLSFEKRLKKELHPQKRNKVIYLRFITVAASAVLLFTLGNIAIESVDFKNDKIQILANLSNDSAGTRLEGVYHFEDKYEKEDAQIMETLIHILHNDENVNVKIATVEALLKFPNSELVRENLITALEKETAPLVQIKLIKSLGALRENRAQKSLENLMNNQETLPIVLSNASLAMATINNK
ncbi:HEAT repeat domain-containing protein [Urechidicola vernalis]|uniref:HEAT repeat domain-containing protein n=1 Tax=Urechidicola vernalis TaxID=3075600 RepID=A0ABU2Y181_9FLAO|nr:HEAT repeat domain-containing protein [Urechidicola sp. P050]MDT0551949.1 HEAT repeat domain-containing protein [Urechidicola sp. P050]